MQWTIFSRLMTGYLALLAPGNRREHVRRSCSSGRCRRSRGRLSSTDNPLLDLHKNLSDALLSEQRYEKKYLIMRDDLLYRGFERSRDEFDQHLRDALRRGRKQGAANGAGPGRAPSLQPTSRWSTKRQAS